jgi:ribosomal protein S18 acetylase RimI-like enzyme
MTQALIRRANPHERHTVRAVVQAVVDEIYGGLWAAPPLPVDEANWELAWVAIANGEIVGVALTQEQWIDDLWVLREGRGRGIGRQLLETAEAEISERGHRELRLRVLKVNARAVEFYQRHGWQTARELFHEKLPVAVLEMVKTNSSETRVSVPC